MSNWTERLGKIQRNTQKIIFAKALQRNGNNYAPLNSFSTPPLNYPLKRSTALTPITSKTKKIGQSSNQRGDLNRIIHRIGGKRKTYKRKTRKNRIRKH